MRYEIRPGKPAPCELVSIAATNFGGEAVNFIAEGTHTYCKRILDAIQDNPKKG